MANNIRYHDVDITGGFWEKIQRRNREITINSVYDRFYDTGRITAFDFDWKPGQDKQPHIFWDSDVAKWMESVAYLTRKVPDAALEARVEALIDRMEEHQDPCGYFNIYFQVVAPDKRWSNVDWHELYCAGHFMEAAVAWFETTGRDRFLKIMCRYADYIEQVFCKEKSAAFAFPGHEEIELALVKLWKCTGEERYLKLSLHFLNVRGDEKTVANMNWPARNFQAHMPVRDMFEAVGHSVRAMYLYTAMADAARLTGDAGLAAACDRLWENVTEKRMYITGGIGSTRHGEAFTIDYDLPNERAYTESCAAIGLTFFAHRMNALHPHGKYGDIAERVLYNGFLSSTNLKGDAFFYENPLEIDLDSHRANKVTVDPEPLPITQRVEVFGCSCCPPNITRFTASLGDLLYTQDENTIYVNQYMDSTASIDGVTITQSTNYPHDGKISLKVTGAAGKTVALRLPGWCADYSLSVNGERCMTGAENGFLHVPVSGDCTLEFNLAMPLQLVECPPQVHENCGRVALTRGPMVYCLEGVDNGADLRDLAIKAGGEASLEYDAAIGAYCIVAEGSRRDPNRFTGLYTAYSSARIPARLRFIPYFAFANRGESDMVVWIQVIG